MSCPEPYPDEPKGESLRACARCDKLRECVTTWNEPHRIMIPLEKRSRLRWICGDCAMELFGPDE